MYGLKNIQKHFRLSVGNNNHFIQSNQIRLLFFIIKVYFICLLIFSYHIFLLKSCLFLINSLMSIKTISFAYFVVKIFIYYYKQLSAYKNNY